MNKFVIALFLVSTLIFAKAIEITPSDVYIEAVKIEKEIAVLKRHFNINDEIEVNKIKTKLHPRHSFQATYILLARINDFREKLGFSITIEPDIAPAESLDPDDVYEATQRILVELKILKKRLGVKEEIEDIEKVEGKTPTDVFNKLFESIYSFNILVGKSVNPNHVFAQVIRLKDDIDLILITLGVQDTSIPPIKNINAKPKDTFSAVEELMKQINLLQKSVGIKRIDLESFKPESEIKPFDVYVALDIAIAEIRTIKAHLELFNSITSSSKRYVNKTPADVEYVVKWCLSQLKLIKTLTFIEGN